MSLFVSTDNARCPVQQPYVFFEFVPQELGRFIIGGQVKVLDFLFHDPVGNGIDIESHHDEPEAIRFQQRRAAPHEGIGDF